jgi:biopolymer transport protein ExbD
MAISLPTGGGGFSSEPNVVPMIDVLLVLLIIFMMQVPLSRKAMDTQVPPPEQPQQDTPQDQVSNQIVLELRPDGSYAVNNDVVPLAQLDARLHQIYDNRPAKLMFIKPAANRRYQDVIEAMDIARGAGVQVIGFTPRSADDEN